MQESNSLSGSTGLGASDRQLLEDAARAAGVTVTEWNDDPRMQCYMVSAGWPLITFNPLTDDGDALRLAALLKLEVNCDAFGGAYTTISSVRLPCPVTLIHAPDAFTATRRAIVLASAAIGAKS